MDLPTADPTTPAEAFANYQQSLASQLRYQLAELNLQSCNNLDCPLTALDAAGGNGVISEFLLSLGHDVTLYDTDGEMLAQARARLGSRQLLERCSLVQGSLENIGGTLANKRYDLIVCHHAIEYVHDGLRLLKTFSDLAAPGGELSLITLNPVSEVMRAMIFRRDPIEAWRNLAEMNYDARWFGNAQLYPFDEIVKRAEQAGWRLKDFRGIRILADYIDEGESHIDQEALLRLEATLASCEPYRRFGRYLQFSFVSDRSA